MARARQKRREAVPASTVVEAVLKRYGVAGAIREHRIVTCWTEIVGERVAARAWPDGLDGGVLWVRVSNSSWMHELSFLREPLAARANEVCGRPPLVREVRFHLGARASTTEDREDVVAALSRRLRPTRAKPSAPRPVPTAEHKTAIDAETAKISDPELRETMRALRHRLGL